MKNICPIIILTFLFSIGNTLNTLGQADTLVDMLQKKGLLTQREAGELKEQMMADIHKQIPSTKITIGGWLDELKINGDARVRYQSFLGRASPSSLGTFDEVDRSRIRLRLRLGLVARAGDWTAGLRLASGDSTGPTADSASTNTTFDQFFGKKNINLDMAYISWEPSKIPNLKFTAGKFENPFWETDMMFDDDITPEGLAQQYNHSLNDRYAIWVNALQSVLAEDNITTNNGSDSRGEDAYLLGIQLGHTWKVIPKKFEVKQGVGYYDYVGLNNQAATTGNTFTGAVIRNRLQTSGTGTVVWLNDYNLLALNHEVKLGYFSKMPVTVMGEYAANLATPDYDDGFKVGLRLWNAKKKGEYEIAYWYEELQADANVSMFTDSDFGSGGTNIQGHSLKLKYNFTDWASMGVAYWYVQNIDDFIAAGDGGINAANNQMRIENRVQLDLLMKF